MANHLGRKPKNGGNPPNDIKFNININFVFFFRVKIFAN